MAKIILIAKEREVEVYLIEYVKKVNGFSDMKIIGVVSNKEKAEKLITDYKKKEGFKKDENGFRIKRPVC